MDKRPCFKVAHKSMEAAIRAAGKATWKNKKNPTKERVRAYLCPRCGLYHIGRGAKGYDRPGIEIGSDGKVALVIRKT